MISYVFFPLYLPPSLSLIPKWHRDCVPSSFWNRPGFQAESQQEVHLHGIWKLEDSLWLQEGKRKDQRSQLQGDWGQRPQSFCKSPGIARKEERAYCSHCSQNPRFPALHVITLWVFKFFLYWRTVDLQCGVSFRRTAKWFSCTCVPEGSVASVVSNSLQLCRL